MSKSSLLNTLAAYVLPRLLDALPPLLRRFRWSPRPHGAYEVLSHSIELELCDVKGERAVYCKRQRVRFQQNNVVAYQDIAWGDGDIFAEYDCSPGEAVDRYREGHRWHVLISLRETKNWGDELLITIRRVIKGGFTGEREDFQTEINHPTRLFSMSLIFPVERPPQRVSLIEQNLDRTTTLDARYIHTLPDGRQHVTWETKRPRLFEAYILAWEW